MALSKSVRKAEDGRGLILRHSRIGHTKVILKGAMLLLPRMYKCGALIPRSQQIKAAAIKYFFLGSFNFD